ncbi:MAG: UDP-N-acetylmuramate dehydrogenase [Bacteroidaceae bacterium]|nr:UDP-N-acetylmuramate dehydrogenase [Bacteroidaceae bacterium]
MWTENFSLLPYNTFGIQAHCKRFVDYQSVDELREALKQIHHSFPNDPILCVGEGSNLLFTKDFEGTVIHSSMTDYEILPYNDQHALIKAEAGLNWDKFVAICLENKLYGLENLSYIPGTVGASAIQNIGAYGVEAEQYIHRVYAIEIATGELRTFSHDELNYGYRQSIFKQAWKGQFIITHVAYKLSLQFNPQIQYGSLSKVIAESDMSEPLTAQSLRELITKIRRAKLPEPTDLGSAGSFFMNPVVTSEKFQSLQQAYPNIPHYIVVDGVKVPAGWLIEQCGWKGHRQGAAGVYDKQALVLVNHGGATGADIVALSEAICRSVDDKFGIQIKPEVNFI